MSQTISLGTKRSGVGVATRSSLVRLRAVFVQVFLVIVYFDVILWLLRFSTDEEAAVGKQYCERLGAYEQGLFVSLFSINFFLDKKLKKTHRSHEIYLFTVLSFVIREWHVQSTYPVRQNFNEWRYSSDFLALETRLSNECRRQFSILLHSYCLTLRLV